MTILQESMFMNVIDSYDGVNWICSMEVIGLAIEIEQIYMFDKHLVLIS